MAPEERIPDIIPAVSVIIVNYNGGEWLKRSVESVLAQTLQNFECFIIDNASIDESMKSINSLNLEADGRFHIIHADENLGFAKGNNLAAQRAKAQWIALLNPDAFAHTDWLEQLLHATTLAPNVTMVGSRQNMALEPGILDGLGDYYHFTGLAWRAGFGHTASARAIPDYHEAFAPCAAASLYHRETFQRLGGFDERFFCYHEDVDIGYRFRLAGGICVQNNKAIVDHVSSGISGRASDFAVYHGTRNRFWTFIKNTPSPIFPLLAPFHIALNLALLTWARFRPGRFAPTWRGVKDGLKGMGEVWKDRKAVQTTRTISSLALLKRLAKNPIKVVKRDVPTSKTFVSITFKAPHD